MATFFDILAGTSARLPVFNQDAWVSGQYSNQGDLSAVLEAFSGVLQYNAQLLQRLNEADWEKTGINAKGEIVSVRQIVNLFILHVAHHLGQIDRIKEQQAAAEV